MHRSTLMKGSKFNRFSIAIIILIMIDVGWSRKGDATMTQLKQARDESRGKDFRWPQSRIRESLRLRYDPLRHFDVLYDPIDDVRFSTRFLST